MPFEERADHSSVTNANLWEELRYIRKKLDNLETKVMFMFGTISTISFAVAVYELLNR